MEDFVNVLRVVVQILAVVLLPIIVWMINSIMKHSQQLLILEEKVNSQINKRLNEIDRKLDQLENELDTKMATFQSELHSKIDMMTSILTTHFGRKRNGHE